VHVPCKGVDHLDFSADQHSLLASCEFAGTVVRVDLTADGGTVAGSPLLLKTGAQPQDVKLSPDGLVYYVADMMSNGVWIVDAHRLRTLGFIPTGKGAHGLYMSRDAKSMYVSNRAEGTVSVVDMATRAVRVKWRIPGRASPDMGGVSADGKTLWLSGRTSSEVYAIDTTTGVLRARIAVGKGPHGLCIWPQPGNFSLGHTGILR
jgi:DNA-binding beta-propeller fold protein YncE